jgi:hypothetical protein
MRRKSLFLSIALVVLIGGTVLGALVLLTRHEPAFYVRNLLPQGQQRQNAALRCTSNINSFVQDVKYGPNRGPGPWRGSFTEEELNSFFAEHLLDSHLHLPEGVSEPRITVEQDRIRLGFRYGTPPLSTIISVDFRVWLAQGQANVIVLELQKLHAGALPISSQSLLKDISEIVSGRIQVSWYRHNGNPTAVLKFQGDQARSTAQLRRLELKPGVLTIVGESCE